MNAVKVARTAVAEYGALQKIGELAGFLSALQDNPPKVVVEIGCDAGGTLYAWRELGAELVVGITLSDGRFGSGRELDAHGAVIIEADSHDVLTRELLEGILDGKEIDLLFIDGDHTYEGVREDFLLYAGLVAESGVIAFHDVVPHPNHPDVGVQTFWSELSGEKEVIVTDDPTWGGIGFVRQVAA